MRRFDFKNKCNCLINYDLLTKAIRHYFPRTTKNVFTIGCKSGWYPRISIGRRAIYVHRLIGFYIYRHKLNNPPLFEEGHFKGKDVPFIHHENDNRLDCSSTNLVLTTNQKHTIGHAAERKQLTGSGMPIGGGRKKGSIYDVAKQDIIFLYQDGYTLRQIGVRYGCHGSTIYNRLKEWNIPRRPTGTRGTK